MSPTAVGVAGAPEAILAGPAGGFGEQDGEAWVSVGEGGLPGWAGDPTGAGRGAVVPVEGEVLLGEAGSVGGARVDPDRAGRVDAVLGGRVPDRLRADVAGVDQVGHLVVAAHEGGSGAAAHEVGDARRPVRVGLPRCRTVTASDDVPAVAGGGKEPVEYQRHANSRADETRWCGRDGRPGR
jgi:hypothetical protein